MYRLLKDAGGAVVRSHKEAFCLANTDAVDYTLPGANWRPDGVDLHDDCGQRTSTTLRQRQDIGSGDTYVQNLPGQAFTTTDLPNGTYYIEIQANPNHRLHERDFGNNISRRRVNLTGPHGARTIDVPPYDGIDGG